MRSSLLCILLATFCFPVFLQAQRATQPADRSLDSLFKQYSGAKRPGCAVAVVKNGTVVFKKGYGMANLAYDVPITTATIFEIGSVSKQFAGLAIATLVQEGKLSLNDDIHKYLPEVPQFGKTITIENLIHHTSGIRDWIETLGAAGWRYEELFSFDDVMLMVKHQKELEFDPGSKWAYCNTGYNLLAAIVEKVSGRTFPQWTEEHIFRPLDMQSSLFLDDNNRIIKNLACSYALRDDHFVRYPSELTSYGSSSLFTSVNDLCKWTIQFQQALASKNPVYTRMLDECTLNNGEKVHYGYGLDIIDDRGLKVIAHSGSWAGYRSVIRNYPDEMLSIIILSNGNDDNIIGKASNVADIFLKGKFKQERKEIHTIAKVDTTLLKRYTGLYKWGGGKLGITLEKEQLMIQYNSENKIAVNAISDTSFWVPGAEMPITFGKMSDGKAQLLIFRSVEGRRIVPLAANFIPLDQYTGTYYSEELESVYKVIFMDGKLFAHSFRRGDSELRRDFEDEFSADIGSVRFFRDKQKKITGFRLSGNRVKNIRFDKKW